MTTIAAIARDGKVHMAADSLTNVYDRPVTGAKKIIQFRWKDYRGLIGICGSGAMADLIDYQLTEALAETPCRIDGDLDGEHRNAHTIACKVTDIITAAGIVEDGKVDGSLLLGWRGRLWTINHNHAIPIPDGVCALGSGEGPAMGAMDAMLADPNRARNDYDRIVKDAVEIACRRDRFSERPVMQVAA